MIVFDTFRNTDYTVEWWSGDEMVRMTIFEEVRRSHMLPLALIDKAVAHTFLSELERVMKQFMDNPGNIE